MLHFPIQTRQKNEDTFKNFEIQSLERAHQQKVMLNIRQNSELKSFAHVYLDVLNVARCVYN